MSTLTEGGISVILPTGWDGQIRTAGSTRPLRAAASGEVRSDDGVGSVLHAASFALPPERGDYGSGAVELMGGSDILVCLLEHPPEDLGTALFRHAGRPRLGLSSFSPQTMQRALPGMAGAQHFFHEGGRAFCLYVVVGSFRTRGPLVRTADAVVRSIRLDDR